MIENKPTSAFQHGILRVWHISLGCLIMGLFSCSAQVNTIPDRPDSFVEGSQSLVDGSVQFQTADIQFGREVHVMRPVSGIHVTSDSSKTRQVLA